MRVALELAVFPIDDFGKVEPIVCGLDSWLAGTSGRELEEVPQRARLVRTFALTGRVNTGFRFRQRSSWLTL